VIDGAKVFAIVIMTISVTGLLLRHSRFVTGAPPENAPVSDDVNVTSVPREIDHSVRWVSSPVFLPVSPNICPLNIDIPSRT